MRTLIIAVQGLRGAPARSALVVVALTLGMLGFVAVLSAEHVVRDTITQRALLSGGAETTLSLNVRGVHGAADVDPVVDQLTRRAGAQSGAAAIENADIGIWIEDHRLEEAQVTFVTPSYRDLHPFPLVQGRWLEKPATVTPRVVVNTAARDQLDPGSPIRIGVPDHLVPLIVTGVVRDGIDEPRVYVEISEYFRFAPVDGSIAVELHAPKLPQDAVKASIRQMTALGAPIELLETHRTDRLGGLAAEVGTTTQVLLILAVLSLASTVVGILNVGLSTAKARAREFTLRRTMGASRAHVAVIVMTESQILAVGAALVAFGGSFLLFPVVIGAFGSQLGIAPPVYDPAYGLICLVVASLAAAASSIVPALLSYRRDLSSVMRE